MLLLDAYNILHVTGVLPPHLAGIDVGGLIELVGTSRYAGDEIVVVCDGQRGVQTARSGGHVRVLFAGAEREADDLIEELLAGTARSKRAVVVSTDARLRRAAGRSHARILRSEVFLHQIAIDRAAHERGRGPATRAHLRPEFAVDLPLDAMSVARWAVEMGAAGAELGDSAPVSAGAAPRASVIAPDRSTPPRAPIPARAKPDAPAPTPAPAIAPRASGAARAPGHLSSAEPSAADLDMHRWLSRTDIKAPERPSEPDPAARGPARAGRGAKVGTGRSRRR